jgi:hypothetical protein
VFILKGFKSFVLEVRILKGLGVCFGEVRIVKGLVASDEWRARGREKDENKSLGGRAYTLPRVFFVRVGGKGLRLDAASTASTFADCGFEVVLFSVRRRWLARVARKGLSREWEPGAHRDREIERDRNERTMRNGSMDFDYCQGNSTIILSFECETGKWSGLRLLAGNWEFGETVW